MECKSVLLTEKVKICIFNQLYLSLTCRILDQFSEQMNKKQLSYFVLFCCACAVYL